ncbi:LOW QUALITY PROTEIN: GSK-3-binding protein-like [Microcaecilia unicolor]|uniref:LOW QUALITY PROTEIN: GSK-3-binding protein-like n=1 Tax=Microcaecilia unicolor TaxID=1415580 RepID=A0A6P7Z5A5_9AMPH|nr:LOW QUALITY PROTEIN: GSK-3-binding protein-like [Microcaecilia unicolor]
MPCCKEDSFLLLEQSVTVGSKDVGRAGGQDRGKPCSSAPGRTQSSCKPQPPPPQQLRAAPYPLSTPRAPLGRLQQQQYRTLAAPPTMDQAASKSRSKQLPGRGWLRGARKQQRQQPGEENDDPHRLLQELILSGNLIKEAVRRLQIAARSTAAINLSSSLLEAGSSGGEPGGSQQQ